MASSVLTPLQAEVLEFVFAEGFGDRGYFLSGGTALSEYYLKHRYSDDLDFFTRRHESLRSDIDDAVRILSRHGFAVDAQRVDDHFGRLFIEPSAQQDGLKIEFVEDAGLRMQAPLRHGVVVIDSFEDIAVNKICAIYDRFEQKDYIDLYFVVTESSFAVEYLLARASQKVADLERGDGQLVFATNLLRVEEFETITTRMIRPIDHAAVTDTLGQTARTLLRQLGTAR